MEPLLSLLADLVRIPSMNPMGRTRTGAAYSEAALAEYVAAYARNAGMDVDMYAVSPHRPNVIARVETGAEQTLMLEAHLDTVHADAMTISPFDPVVHDGNLYGRGACDTKGSLAAFLYAVTSLLADGSKLRHNVLLVAVADEEYQFTGARTAVAKGLHADFGIAGEPTGLHIVRAHKGVTRWRMHTQGKAAHSAYPERGENAIYRMGEILVRLDAYASGLRQTTPHPVLGPRTLSVGVIEGGQAVNIVPDSCTIEIDRRTLPGETRDDVLGPVEQLLSDISEWKMDEPHLSVEGMDVAGDAAIVRLLREAIAAEHIQPVVEGAQYTTDAGTYNGAGIPTVVFGPGDITRAHTAEEYIEVEQLNAAVRIIRRTLT
jgi:acetylornithine deacetylase/succinyl-diaminopimelate desuccinylase family protein